MIKILRYTYTWLKPYMKAELLGFLLTAIYAVTVFLVPLASENLIDNVIPSDNIEMMVTGLVYFSVICLSSGRNCE